MLTFEEWSGDAPRKGTERMLAEAATALGVEFVINRISKYAAAKPLAAVFDAEGELLEGSDKIRVEKVACKNDRGEPSDNRWYYEVEPIEEYTFLRVPLSPGAVREHIDCHRPTGVPIPGRFRWIESIPTFPHGHPTAEPNVPVGFMVFGYRPKDLLEASVAKGPPG